MKGNEWQIGLQREKRAFGLLSLLQKWRSVADPIKLFSSLTKNFSVFTAKLGHFITNVFSICNKHSSLTAKIGNVNIKYYSASECILSGIIELVTYFN